jgi:outer membrane biosynthesis protein TonB
MPERRRCHWWCALVAFPHRRLLRRLPKPKAPSGPQRIGGQVMRKPTFLRSIQPIYPPLAKSARVQGTVEFTATISKEGNIENLQLVAAILCW